MTYPGQPPYPTGPQQWPPQQWPMQPPPKKRKWPWIVGGIFGFLVLISAVGGNSTPSGTTPAPTALPTVQQAPAAVSAQPAPARPDPTVIKVKQMGDDFEANQLAAERKWGGQYVQFTAPVGNINSYSVSFTDVTTKFSFTQVSCRFQDENAVLNLAKDKPATVRGVVGDDQLLGVISLEDCEIVG